jgi:peptidoglycan/xylan/chitin deacetylase (PgdA/CDA1 family)
LEGSRRSKVTVVSRQRLAGLVSRVLPPSRGAKVRQGVRLKSWLKSVSVAATSVASGRDPRNRVVVLCYHSIHPVKAFASATPALFERHLVWLREECEVIPFTEVRHAADAGQRSRPAVAITFDDGYEDNHEYAFPILKEVGLPATFFLTVGLVELERTVVERFKSLRGSARADIRPLTWQQIQEMREAGFGFGSHTYSHANLALLDRGEAQRELVSSRETLEARLGETVTTLAYPFGKPRRHFTDETMDLAAEAGYTDAAAVLFRAVRPSDSRLSVPRFFVTRDDVESLQKKVSGSWDFLGWWQEKAPAWAARLVSPADFRV